MKKRKIKIHIKTHKIYHAVNYIIEFYIKELVYL